MDKVILISQDEEYVNSIEGILAENINNKFELEIITDKQYLEEYLKIPHKIKMLIIDEALAAGITQPQAVEKILRITDADKIGPGIISKLSGGTGILKMLGPVFVKSGGSSDGLKTRITDVVSVSDPDIKTTIASSLAIRLARFGKKVLYLNAENMQLFQRYLDVNVSLSRESAALAMNAALNGDIKELDQVIYKGEVDYVPAFEHLLSAYGMNAGTIFAFAKALQRLEIYDEIVIEHPYGFASESISRLERSENIVIVSGQDAMSYRKLQSLIENTREISQNSVIVLYGQYSGELNDQFESLGINISEKIDRLKIDPQGSGILDPEVLRSTAEAIL